jgi:hypothetical protein
MATGYLFAMAPRHSPRSQGEEENKGIITFELGTLCLHSRLKRGSGLAHGIRLLVVPAAQASFVAGVRCLDALVEPKPGTRGWAMHGCRAGGASWKALGLIEQLSTRVESTWSSGIIMKHCT